MDGTILLLGGTFLACLALSVPIAVSIGIATVVTMLVAMTRTVGVTDVKVRPSEWPPGSTASPYWPSPSLSSQARSSPRGEWLNAWWTLPKRWLADSPEGWRS